MNGLQTLSPHTQLAVERLREYVRAADAPNTLAAYENDLRHYKAWGGTIPSTPTLVADYLVAQAGTLRMATLRRRLVAISRAHTTYGLPNPVPTEIVRLTLRGIANKHGQPQRKLKPLVKEDVLRLLVGMDNSLRGLRNQALLLITFAGGFRRSEVTALRAEDMTFQREGVIITLPRSKTDQQGVGRKVAIPYGRGSVCPVKALQTWLAIAVITDGPIFRQVTKGGNVGGKLSPQAMVELVQEWLENVGMETDGIGPHSLRAGMITSATQAGIPTHKIMAQSGHRSVEVMNGYIRDADIWNHNAGGLF